jgi:hypothetical protein
VSRDPREPDREEESGDAAAGQEGRAEDAAGGEEGRTEPGPARSDRVEGSPAAEDQVEALSPSFRLTTAFLERHPRYRNTLALTPEHFRFDPVLWHSSIATLRAMLRAVAGDVGLAVEEDDLDVAVRNLVEGIVLRSRAWDQ